MKALGLVVSDKKIFENCILKKNYFLTPWPTYATNWNGLNKFDRWPPRDYPFEVRSKSKKWFQRRCCLKKLLTVACTHGRRTTDIEGSQKLTEHFVLSWAKMQNISFSMLLLHHNLARLQICFLNTWKPDKAIMFVYSVEIFIAEFLFIFILNVNGYDYVIHTIFTSSLFHFVNRHTLNIYFILTVPVVCSISSFPTSMCWRKAACPFSLCTLNSSFPTSMCSREAWHSAEIKKWQCVMTATDVFTSHTVMNTITTYL